MLALSASLLFLSRDRSSLSLAAGGLHSIDAVDCSISKLSFWNNKIWQVLQELLNGRLQNCLPGWCKHRNYEHARMQWLQKFQMKFPHRQSWSIKKKLIEVHFHLHVRVHQTRKKPKQPQLIAAVPDNITCLTQRSQSNKHQFQMIKEAKAACTMTAIQHKCYLTSSQEHLELLPLLDSLNNGVATLDAI